jgi:hypothetical protein
MSVTDQERRAAESKRHQEATKQRIAGEQRDAKRRAERTSQGIRAKQRAQEELAGAAMEQSRRAAARIEGR